MSLRNLTKNGEFRRHKSQAALACFFYVKGRLSVEPKTKVNESIEEFMDAYDVSEDIVPLKWLLNEYYRLQKREISGSQNDLLEYLEECQ